MEISTDSFFGIKIISVCTTVPSNCVLHGNFHRLPVTKNEYQLKRLSKQMGITWNFTYTHFFVQRNGYILHGNFYRFFLAEKIIWIYHGWVYIVQAIEYYLEISIDNLWQTISERNLIHGIGHYIEISIDSLWQRISETILSKIDTLWQRNLKQFWSMQAVERHLKIFIESLGLRIYLKLLSKQLGITWKFL